MTPRNDFIYMFILHNSTTTTHSLLQQLYYVATSCSTTAAAANKLLLLLTPRYTHPLERIYMDSSVFSMMNEEGANKRGVTTHSTHAGE